MTCKNEISNMFKEKSRNELLDYVCNRIDESERNIEELWNCIGMTLAYLETNENYTKEKLKDMLKTSQQHCIEHYKDNWLSKFKNKGDQYVKNKR